MTPKSIPYFKGQHCETTVTGTLLLQLGIQLSEPMLFGMGEGLGYIYWNMRGMNCPFMGGRIKTDVITQNLSRHLQLKLIVNENTSPTKAWQGVKKLLDEGKVVGLKLDCYHLEYFKNAIHFAGHYVAIYDYDDEMAYLIDTVPQGSTAKTSLKSLALARAEKGPMSSRNLYYILEGAPANYKPEKSIVMAIKNNAHEYLNPPISNLGYKGIFKTSQEILKWFKESKKPQEDFKLMAMLMEKAGTGGALFRNLYRDFLKESYELLEKKELRAAHEHFIEIAELWTLVSQKFEMTAKTLNENYITEASEILKQLSAKEKEAMQMLLDV